MYISRSIYSFLYLYDIDDNINQNNIHMYVSPYINNCYIWKPHFKIKKKLSIVTATFLIYYRKTSEILRFPCERKTTLISLKVVTVCDNSKYNWSSDNENNFLLKCLIIVTKMLNLYNKRDNYSCIPKIKKNQNDGNSFVG